MKKLRLILTQLLMTLGLTANAEGFDFAAAWSKVDNLMNKPALIDAGKELSKIEKEAVKKKDEPQMLKCEIYSYAIDMGCEYAMTNDKAYHAPNNQSRQEGSDITIEHYKKAAALKEKLTDSVVIVLTEWYMADLLNKYADYSSLRWSDRSQVENGIQPIEEKSWPEVKEIITSHLVAATKKLERISDVPLDKYSSIVRTISSKDTEAKNKDIFTSLMDLVGRRCVSIYEEVNGRAEVDLLFDECEEGQSEIVGYSMNREQTIKALNNDPKVSKGKFGFDLSIYSRIENEHRRKGEKDAAIWAAIERIKNIKERTVVNQDDKRALLIDAYDKLINEFPESNMTMVSMAEKATEMFSETQSNCREEDFDPELPAKINSLCEDAIKRFPISPYINSIKAVMERLTQHTMSPTIQSDVYSKGETPVVKIHYTNCNKASINLWKVNATPEEIMQKGIRQLRDKFVAIKLPTSEISLEKTNYYIPKDTSVSLPSNLEYGYYVMQVKDAEQLKNYKDEKYPDYMEFKVTDMFSFNFADQTGRHLYVVDRQTGTPMPNAKVTAHNHSWKTNKTTTTTKTTDANGKVVTVSECNWINIENGNDKHCYTSTSHQYRRNRNEANKEINIYTDRAIYRPGDTIKFKSVFYSIGTDLDKVMSNENLKVTLKDANYQTVSEQNLQTNSWGSIKGEFVIPKNLLPGNFSLTVRDNDRFSESIYVKVEEYKRPSIEIECEDPTGSMKYGEEVQIHGTVKMMSGESCEGVVVKAKIDRSSLSGFYRGYRSESKTENIQVETDADGKFVIKFVPERDPMASDTINEISRFSVKLTATEKRGETAETQTSVYVSDNEIKLGLNVPSVTEKSENGVIKVTCADMYDRPKKCDAVLTIKDNAETIIYNKTITVDGQTEIKIADVVSIPGKYNVTIVEKCDKKIKAFDYSYFTYYDIESKLSPIKGDDHYLWCNKGTAELAKDEDLTIYVASQGELNILMLTIGNKSIKPKSEEWLKMNNEGRKITIPYSKIFDTDSRAETTEIVLCAARDGKFEEHHISIYKKDERPVMKVSLASFRDNITPGAKEKWTIKVENSKEGAEILSSMYDASLDAYISKSWNRLSQFRPYCTQTHINRRRGGTSGTSYVEPMKYSMGYNSPMCSSMPMWQYAINPYSHHYSTYVSRIRSMKETSRVCYASYDMAAPCEVSLAVEDVEEEVADEEIYARVESSNVFKSTAPTMGTASASIQQEMDAGEIERLSNKSLRSNFAETAFFLPSVVTDSKGNAEIEFEVPHSLTKWKFRALAHSTDANSAVTEQVVVSSLPFSVRPLLPRFLRCGDEVVISASVINRSSDKLTGKAYIIITNAETDKTIEAFSTDFKKVEKETQCEFKFKVPYGISAVKIKTMAESGEFSDGEESLLPVLPDGNYVTKAKSILARKGESKTVEIDMPEKSAKDVTAKIEYSANAVWLCMASMRYITETDARCADDIAMSLYVNGLIGGIAQKWPDIRVTAEKWKNSHSETTISPLCRNEELKNALLNETPWVREAQSETAWMNDLVNTLDMKRVQKDNAELSKSLSDLQNADGGFCWLPGTQSSYYITMTVVSRLSLLYRDGLLGYVPNGDKMLKSAVKYLDNEIKKDLDRRDIKKMYVSEWDLQWMLIRDRVKRVHPMTGKVKELYDHCLSTAKKEWKDFSLYGKSCLSILLYKDGDKDFAKKIVESVRQSSTSSETLGMYWKEASGYSLYDGDIMRHTMAMQAFAMIDRKENEMEELTLWLINRKESSSWGNPMLTAEAVDAIMTCGTANLSPSESKLTWGSEHISTGGKEGDSYITRSVKGDEFDDSHRKVSVTQSEDGVGIGAIYLNYYCPYSETQAASNGLSVKKTTYVVRGTDKKTGKELLTEVKDGMKLKRGDKLKIVLAVRSDRDVDFVCLKDLRPSCTEPPIQLSGRKWQDNITYYGVTTDCSTRMYFDRLTKGNFVMEYTLFVTHSGTYTSGVATIQSSYAPKFVGNSGNGVKIVVE